MKKNILMRRNSKVEVEMRGREEECYSGQDLCKSDISLFYRSNNFC